jgi:hypothetical protein
MQLVKQPLLCDWGPKITINEENGRHEVGVGSCKITSFGGEHSAISKSGYSTLLTCSAIRLNLPSAYADTPYPPHFHTRLPFSPNLSFFTVDLELRTVTRSRQVINLTSRHLQPKNFLSNTSTSYPYCRRLRNSIHPQTRIETGIHNHGPQTGAPTASLTGSIALPYRVYFLYLDPIFAIGGVYLILR